MTVEQTVGKTVGQTIEQVSAGTPYRGRHRPAVTQRPSLRVTASEIGFEVDGRAILDDVSLTLEPGSLTALTGPTGAGKSTLLWILAGALRATTGVVRYGDTPVADHDDAARLGLQLLPQGVALVAPLTARENILVPLMAQRVSPAEARDRADAALEDVGLGETGDHLVEELSGGQQQRVAVGRALALRPGVILADEPTSELDATTRDVIVGLLAAEADAGAVVLLATHDSWCADQADAEYHLDEGRLLRVR